MEEEDEHQIGVQRSEPVCVTLEGCFSGQSLALKPNQPESPEVESSRRSNRRNHRPSSRTEGQRSLFRSQPGHTVPSPPPLGCPPQEDPLSGSSSPGSLSSRLPSPPFLLSVFLSPCLTLLPVPILSPRALHLSLSARQPQQKPLLLLLLPQPCSRA